MSQSKADIRKQFKRQRNSLSDSEQAEAAIGIARQARRLAALMRSTRVASYMPVRGEVSPHALLNEIRPQAFLPVITDLEAGQMNFCSAYAPVLYSPLTKHQAFARRVPVNAFGIPEPVLQHIPVRTRSLDAVLVPLVAFDRCGNRLGMGAGFYDRAFDYRLWGSDSARPMLIGLAHSFQEVNQIDSASWDVPLDVIITPQELIRIA